MTIRHSNFQAIGTKWELQIRDVVSEAAWDTLLQQVHQRIAAFDKAYSRFRPDSLVTKLAQDGGTQHLPGDGEKMLAFYERLYQATDGKITPLIGNLVAAAGYDAEYSFMPKQMQTPPRWETVLSYDTNSLTVTEPVLLDFGAAGKGYLVDIVAEVVAATGVHNYTINAGGDILHRSSSAEPLVAGMENPLDTTEAIGTIQLSNQSLCASAGSKRAWGGFHHIINPDKLSSPEKVIATWVLASDTMAADGLATALFFVEPQQLEKHFEFSYAVMTKDMGVVHTNDFPLTLFTAE